ncbi:TIGR03618 family F420-dependent PPOX class oxidoreductase [Microbacterium sp. 10M-3C3]|jgi:PPOX class probable F420-dependent enzyme|uniref:TIGR03618 family F420-dependent PPOX class oxidoreductase n=1 Tax=Microbacterium sp. 10M-3C3 TaxID=2483401 RepID=UPI000F643F62|nr:TIGR03618 family F420-dependent PPOX class oxidoreductase [Microbacterium sp. 10M-3C3]
MAQSWESVRRSFEAANVAHVATLMPDGSPHSVPVWVGVEGDDLAFFSIARSVKDRNIQADPRVALSIVDPANMLSHAAVRGRVHRRLEGAEAMPIVDRIARKYTGKPYDIRTGIAVFLVDPVRSWSVDYSGRE